VVDLVRDREPLVDEETLEDRTVAVEELLPLEEVEVQVKLQTHERPYLPSRSQNVDSIPHLLYSTTSAMYHTYLDHGLFLLHETQDLVLYLLSSTTLLLTACLVTYLTPRLYIAVSFRQKKKKFSDMFQWMDGSTFLGSGGYLACFAC
jgi:hypothetical protein